MDAPPPRTLPGVRDVAVLPTHGPATYWDTGGPPGAPTLVLLHGVTLTAEVNWSAVAPWLAQRYRVVAVDLSGPGRRWVSGLDQHADDVAHLARLLGLGPVVPVGFSLGGLVAQLLWRRHPDLVRGLVLCATSRNVAGAAWSRPMAQFLPVAATSLALLPGGHLLRADVLGASLLDAAVEQETRRWAMGEMQRTPLLAALASVRAACTFSSHSWISDVDVPSAVVLTLRDRVVPPLRQWKLADALPACTVHQVDAGHGAFLDAPGAFAAALLDACGAVTGTGTDSIAS
jgi:pimeloyl-ACP methyl ester carboxylesterase